MGPINAEWLLELLILAPPLLLSLTVHEFAHARTALAFGDPTAKYMGRVTLNPLAHLDPVGTLVLLLTRTFGWARPVPVNPANLSPRRLGDVMVSLAGPMSNFALAIVSGLALRLLIHFHVLADNSFGHSILTLLRYTMLANVGLGVFNLIPLFPLDGHHILREVLPPAHHAGFMQWQLRYGRPLLMGIIFLPMLTRRVAGPSILDPLGLIFGPIREFAMRLALG